MNKVSKSTNERSDYRRDRNNDYLDYDFDFKNEEEGQQGQQGQEAAINEQNEDEESTLQLRKEITDF